MSGDAGPRRRIIYLGALVLFGLTSSAVNLKPWTGTAQLHTLMELAATLLDFVVGTLALARFYSKKDSKFLCIGTAFI